MYSTLWPACWPRLSRNWPGTWGITLFDLLADPICLEVGQELEVELLLTAVPVQVLGVALQYVHRLKVECVPSSHAGIKPEPSHRRHPSGPRCSPPRLPSCPVSYRRECTLFKGTIKQYPWAQQYLKNNSHTVQYNIMYMINWRYNSACQFRKTFIQWSVTIQKPFLQCSVPIQDDFYTVQRDNSETIFTVQRANSGRLFYSAACQFRKTFFNHFYSSAC